MKPKLIERQMMAVYAPFAMLAGMQLELFTHLSSGSHDVESLSTRIGVRASKLRPLLYSLASAGLLEEERGIFANSAEAGHFLVKGEAHTEREYRTWLEAAGFKDIQRIVQTRGYSLIRAIKR